jgi:arylsulfatase
MSRSGSRSAIVGLVLTAIACLAATYLWLDRSGERALDERWPAGSLADLARLRDRTDVNVLFILIDTLRSDRLSVYGYARETSPAIDWLAHRGIRFAHHLSQSSWTKTSMASMWTGLYPTRTGILSYDDIVSPNAEMPAEALKRAGFRTIGLYRNGWVAPSFGFDQGFDVYTRPPRRPVDPALRRENPTLVNRGSDEELIASALEFLRVDGGERWFLYLHLMDLHEYTYDEESALFGGSYSDIYDNSIRWTSGTIQILLEYLLEWGHMDDTIVVIASDHGEAFRERGFEGHARQVFRETTEVPLIIGLPFRLEPGVVVSARSQNVDIWPTLYDLLGIAGPEASDGMSLVPAILAAARGEALADGDRMGFAHLNRNWGKRGMPPAPTTAVVDGERPEELARLRGAADAQEASVLVWGKPEVRELNDLQLNQLRALGYAVP